MLIGCRCEHRHRYAMVHRSHRDTFCDWVSERQGNAGPNPPSKPVEAELGAGDLRMRAMIKAPAPRRCCWGRGSAWFLGQTERPSTHQEPQPPMSRQKVGARRMLGPEPEENADQAQEHQRHYVEEGSPPRKQKAPASTTLRIGQSPSVEAKATGCLRRIRHRGRYAFQREWCNLTAKLMQINAVFRSGVPA
jgi:hypothetical protein